MHLCRFQVQGSAAIAFYYDDEFLFPLPSVSSAFQAATDQELAPAENAGDLLPHLGPDGVQAAQTRRIAAWFEEQAADVRSSLAVRTDSVTLLVPVPRPNKLFLLAGNYAAHIEEGGEIAAERAETFPYVFMKPPSTTLTHPSSSIKIPEVSPAAIDWELELAVIIGRGGKQIAEDVALSHIAGYTVLNDISDRHFRPNPARKLRERDRFFDWLHGKWHDSFCPCGPCAVAADAIHDPQQLALQLRVNGRLMQDASTAMQIFPVATVIEFISSFVTLEPGDIISTGTPSGVGNTTQTYLQSGDRIEASISEIGTLVTHVA